MTKSSIIVIKDGENEARRTEVQNWKTKSNSDHWIEFYIRAELTDFRIIKYLFYFIFIQYKITLTFILMQMVQNEFHCLASLHRLLRAHVQCCHFHSWLKWLCETRSLKLRKPSTCLKTWGVSFFSQHIISHSILFC